jgi:ribosome-binding protein aMBF1 (putative translation factor)
MKYIKSEPTDQERARAENIKRVQQELADLEARQKRQPLSAERDLFFMQLLQARLKRGLSQADLASRLTMSQSAISRIESGRGNPSLNTILKVIKALNANLMIE